MWIQSSTTSNRPLSTLSVALKATCVTVVVGIGMVSYFEVARDVNLLAINTTDVNTSITDNNDLGATYLRSEKLSRFITHDAERISAYNNHSENRPYDGDSRVEEETVKNENEITENSQDVMNEFVEQLVFGRTLQQSTDADTIRSCIIGVLDERDCEDGNCPSFGGRQSIDACFPDRSAFDQDQEALDALCIGTEPEPKNPEATPSPTECPDIEETEIEDLCEDESLSFKDDPTKDCEWVANSANPRKNCDKPAEYGSSGPPFIRDICRRTCGTCGESRVGGTDVGTSTGGKGRKGKGKGRKGTKGRDARDGNTKDGSKDGKTKSGTKDGKKKKRRRLECDQGTVSAPTSPPSGNDNGKSGKTKDGKTKSGSKDGKGVKSGYYEAVGAREEYYGAKGAKGGSKDGTKDGKGAKSGYYETVGAREEYYGAKGAKGGSKDGTKDGKGVKSGYYEAVGAREEYYGAKGSKGGKAGYYATQTETDGARDNEYYGNKGGKGGKAGYYASGTEAARNSEYYGNKGGKGGKAGYYASGTEAARNGYYGAKGAKGATLGVRRKLQVCENCVDSIITSFCARANSPTSRPFSPGPPPPQTPIPRPPLPTPAPTSPEPSESPSEEPTPKPSDPPTTSPSESPTKDPTREPTPSPTDLPSEDPTPKPSDPPTTSPSVSPTREPTPNPTTASPTQGPSASSAQTECDEITSFDPPEVTGRCLAGGSEQPFQKLPDDAIVITGGNGTEVSVTVSQEWKDAISLAIGFSELAQVSQCSVEENVSRGTDFDVVAQCVHGHTTLSVTVYWNPNADLAQCTGCNFEDAKYSFEDFCYYSIKIPCEPLTVDCEPSAAPTESGILEI